MGADLGADLDAFLDVAGTNVPYIGEPLGVCDYCCELIYPGQYTLEAQFTLSEDGVLTFKTLHDWCAVKFARDQGLREDFFVPPFGSADE